MIWSILRFFGFWKYTLAEQSGRDVKEYTVIYWTCLPWIKYYRKFDLIKIFKREYNIDFELKRVSGYLD